MKHLWLRCFLQGSHVSTGVCVCVCGEAQHINNEWIIKHVSRLGDILVLPHFTHSRPQKNIKDSGAAWMTQTNRNTFFSSYNWLIISLMLMSVGFHYRLTARWMTVTWSSLKECNLDLGNSLCDKIAVMYTSQHFSSFHLSHLMKTVRCGWKL